MSNLEIEKVTNSYGGSVINDFKVDGVSFSDFIFNNEACMLICEDGYDEYLAIIDFLDNDKRFVRLASQGLTNLDTRCKYGDVELRIHYDSFDNGDLSVLYNCNDQEVLNQSRIGASIIKSYVNSLSNNRFDRK